MAIAAKDDPRSLSGPEKAAVLMLSLGEEYGLTEQGAYQAVMREKRRQRKLTPFYPNGVLVDPDGIGEFEDEWTVEEMYKNMFDTVFDS